MLFVVTLSYIRSLEEVDAHLESHRAWLDKHFQAGRIFLAGPLEPRTGGLLLAWCEDRAELESMLAEDSFNTHRVADYDVRCVAPTLRAEVFPAMWAPQARAASSSAPR